MADDDIDLAALSDDDLVPQMHDDLYDGLKEEIEQGVNILLGRGWTPYDVLTKALVEGMRIVGEDFRDGILFVPEVLLSANAMKAGMAILRPLLAETGAPISALAAAGVPAHRLEIEITETVLMQNTEHDRHAASAARARRAHLDGRLRHRLFVAQLSAQLPVRQDQDRPLLHQRPAQRQRIPSRSCGRWRGWREPQHDGNRRRRRDAAAVRAARARSAAPRCRAICSARRGRSRKCRS